MSLRKYLEYLEEKRFAEIYFLNSGLPRSTRSAFLDKYFFYRTYMRRADAAAKAEQYVRGAEGLG
jgi:hypothetical protein